MGVNFAIGPGDTRERPQASHEAAARLHDSLTRDDRFALACLGFLCLLAVGRDAAIAAA